VILNVLSRIFIYIFLTLILFSCKTPPQPPQETEIPVVQQPPAVQQSSGLADEIRSLTETGILSSMLRAVDLIRSRDLGGSEFGRTMSGINTILIRLIYPDSPARLPTVDLPQTSNYARIIREAERGNYIRPSSSSTVFFEHILPFLAISGHNDVEIWSNVIRDLNRAGELRPNSILPPYFRGITHELAGQHNDAINAYSQAYAISNECYPAQIRIASLRRISGNAAEAVSILSELIIRFPDSMEIKRELALAYYSNNDWSRALPAIDEILRSDPRDGEFLLMRAAILIEQGHYSQANVSLDNYAAINQTNRNYLFMRARIQAEGNRNRDSALNYLRSIMRANPNDTEAMIFAVTLLMESQRPADHSEGRQILERLRQIAGSSMEVLNLSLRDAVRRESWQEAQVFLNQILSARRTVQDLIDAYHIEKGLGNNTRAYNFASELYERDPSNNEYAIIYISALIDTGRRAEALRLIESRLNTVTNASVKSRFFYLRSRLQTNTDDELSDLRSSLFEDPRNLDAIIAMFEIYHNRREERRAVSYLRQALAIAPDHPLLRQYEREYASLLGRN